MLAYEELKFVLLNKRTTPAWHALDSFQLFLMFFPGLNTNVKCKSTLHQQKKSDLKAQTLLLFMQAKQCKQLPLKEKLKYIGKTASIKVNILRNVRNVHSNQSEACIHRIERHMWIHEKCWIRCYCAYIFPIFLLNNTAKVLKTCSSLFSRVYCTGFAFVFY